LFYTDYDELTEKLKNTYIKPKNELLIETKNALATARKHLEPGSSNRGSFLYLQQGKAA
jgi:hypothetical protein